MNWVAPVDIYCERLSAAFWAEPFNAFSNVAFIIAAFVAWRTARRLGVRGVDLTVLIVLAGLVGIGSFLFHTFANRWSELADVVPIWTFVAVLVLVAIHRIGGVRPGKLAMGAIGVLAIMIIVMLASGEGDAATSPTPPILNGSLQYAPAAIAMLVFSLIGWWRASPMAPWIWAATGTFVISLAFRTVDLALCDVWATGTHFIWHALNGLMIGILLDGMIRLRARQPG